MRQIKGCLQAEPCDYSAAVPKILLLLALAGVVEAEMASQAGFIQFSQPEQSVCFTQEQAGRDRHRC